MMLTGPYKIVKLTAVGGYKLKDKHGNCLKTTSRLVKWYYQGMPTGDDDQIPLPSYNISVEITGVDVENICSRIW